MLSTSLQKMMMALIILSSCSALLPGKKSDSGQVAPNADGQETHGGDRLASQFIAKGYRVYDFILNAGDTHAILTKPQLDGFLQLLVSTRVQPIKGPIRDARGAVVDARNGKDPLRPGLFLIEIDRDRWEQILGQKSDAYRLVFHEYLWLLGIDDENYKVSNRLSVLDSLANGLGRWQEMSDEGAPFSDLYNAAIDTATVVTKTHFVMSQSGAKECEPVKISTYDLSRRQWADYTLPAKLVGIDRTMIAVENQVLIWSGICTPQQGGTVDGGILFNPTDGTWKPMSAVNSPVPRHGGLPILTPKGVVVYSGSDNNGRVSDGGLYDVKGDAWSLIPNSPLPLGEYAGGYVDRPGTAFDQHVLVWETRNTSCDPVGAVYGLTSSEWIVLQSKAPKPKVCDWKRAIWTGKHIAFLARRYDAGDVGSMSEAGWLWDPQADLWTPITMNGAPNVYVGSSVVWSGSQLIVFGGKNLDGEATSVGAAYSVETGIWRQLTSEGAPTKRYAHVAYWVNDRMLIWGGRSNIGTNVRTGAIWIP